MKHSNNTLAGALFLAFLAGVGSVFAAGTGTAVGMMVARRAHVLAVELATQPLRHELAQTRQELAQERVRLDCTIEDGQLVLRTPLAPPLLPPTPTGAP